MIMKPNNKQKGLQPFLKGYDISSKGRIWAVTASVHAITATVYVIAAFVCAVTTDIWAIVATMWDVTTAAWDAAPRPRYLHSVGYKKEKKRKKRKKNGAHICRPELSECI